MNQHFLFVLGIAMLSLLYSCHSSKSAVIKSMEEQIAIDLELHQDGPFLFIENDQIMEKKIVNGEVVEKTYQANNYPLTYKPQESVYTTTSKIAALSDLHGQYDLAVTLLKNNGIIDDQLNWSFGDGHFVLVGDVFDRGPKTMETLWLIYKLEQQAAIAGGKLHYLMGNHEYMVLRGDLRYLHDSDSISASLLNTTFDQLFDDETVLGRWLRSKSTIIKINDIVFVHGGISELFLGDSFDLKLANEEYRETFDLDRATVKASAQYSKYHNSDCPIWYRGYFAEGFSDADVDRILSKLNANHIIVGHTSQTEILRLNNGKIYCVDSSIKRGKYGEILFIENGEFSKQSLSGEQLTF